MNMVLLEGASGSGYGQMIMLVLMIVVMYFFFLRPQKKRRKELEEMRSSLAKGDQVVVGGIYGKVIKIDEDIVTLEVEEGKLKVAKQYIEKVPE